MAMESFVKWRSIQTLALWLAGCMVCYLLQSCAVGPNYKRPHGRLPVASYTGKVSDLKTVATNTAKGQAQSLKIGQDIPAQWWEVFHSGALNELVMASFRCNPQVTAAKAALHAALETVYAQRTAFFPFVGVSFTPSMQQTAAVLQSNLANNKYIYSLYTGQLFVSYTLDVFGGIRRQVESFVALAKLQRFELEATYLTLSTNVVNAAIQEASAREQVRVTKKLIASSNKILAMTKQRLALGDATVADVAIQSANLAAFEATLPPLEKQMALQHDLLNALTGRTPDDKRTPLFYFKDIGLPTQLPISLPATLLEHRPDIRAAEERMHSANALIGVAVANRLPNVTLGVTNLGEAATNLPLFFTPNSNFWALTGIIVQPVLDAGRLLHQQRAARDYYIQAAALYRSTIINAFQNVADTLKAIHFDALTLKAARYAERSAFKSLEISRQQQQLGDTNMFYVLLNEQLYQQAQLNLVQAQTNRLTDTVALFQALGGGWWNRCCRKVKHCSLNKITCKKTHVALSK